MVRMGFFSRIGGIQNQLYSWIEPIITKGSPESMPSTKSRKLKILLLQPPKFQNHRCEPPHLAQDILRIFYLICQYTILAVMTER